MQLPWARYREGGEGVSSRSRLDYARLYDEVLMELKGP